MTVPYQNVRDGVTSRIFLTPVDLDGTELGGRDIHAEDDAESRDDVCLTLKAGTCGADGEKIIRIRCVLGGANLMFEAAV